MWNVLGQDRVGSGTHRVERLWDPRTVVPLGNIGDTGETESTHFNWNWVREGMEYPSERTEVVVGPSPEEYSQFFYG